MKNRIKELRLKKNLTLKELSNELKKKGVKISPDSLAKYERNERNPKIDKWQALANFFNVPVAYLQGVDDNRNPNSFTKLYEIYYKLYNNEISDKNYLKDVSKNHSISTIARLKALNSLADAFTQMDNTSKEYKTYLNSIMDFKSNSALDDAILFTNYFFDLAIDANKDDKKAKELYLELIKKLIEYKFANSSNEEKEETFNAVKEDMK